MVRDLGLGAMRQGTLAAAQLDDRAADRHGLLEFGAGAAEALGLVGDAHGRVHSI